MSRILVVDDSPHAQRMGERILTEEGYEVVTVSNADSALIRLEDVDPDVLIADTVMPGRTGFEICQYLKMSPRHKHVRVILTAGVLEPFDQEKVRQVMGDGTLKKPFEATALLAAVKPLAEAAVAARAAAGSAGPKSAGQGSGAKGPAAGAAAPFIAVVDPEQVRAAVTVALDAAMSTMVDEITSRVTAALSSRKSVEQTAAAPAVPSPPTVAPSTAAVSSGPPQPEPQPATPPMLPRVETVRRVNAVRSRGSILGLDIGRRESQEFQGPLPTPTDSE